MPKHGERVLRFDKVRDVRNGVCYQVTYITDLERESYYLTGIEPPHKIKVVGTEELKEFFEKYTDRPA
jgi:hypothetical protein